MRNLRRFSLEGLKAVLRIRCFFDPWIRDGKKS
jgi:hypothetical protein